MNTAPLPKKEGDMAAEYSPPERIRALETRADTVEATIAEHKEEIALLRRYVIAAEKAAEIEKESQASSFHEQRKLLMIFGLIISFISVIAPFVRQIVLGG